MSKSILFVCLGNICRSPAAEGVFLKKIKDHGLQDSFLVDSAGTGGWHVGNKADIRMRNAALRRGILIESLSRKIEFHDFVDFDYILTMDNSNLANVNSLRKQSGLTSSAIIKPILSFAKNTDLLEVPDPYYGGDHGFEIVLDLLQDSIDGLFSEITLKE